MNEWGYKGRVRYKANGKIYYNYSVWIGSVNTSKFNSITDAGSSFSSTKGYYDFSDITPDGRYRVNLIPSYTGLTNIQVLDHGALLATETELYSKTFDVNLFDSKITSDGKKIYSAYLNESLKQIGLHILDVNSKLVTEKVIGLYNLQSVFLSMPSDNKTLLFTSDKKTYVYNIEKAEVTGSFESPSPYLYGF